jgi:DNA mismatch repair protein MutL
MDAKLANMIAAGEVVDRPASVIKELIENAIDAHATQLSVEVFDMGMSKIIVTDNGVGMDHEDAHLAFLRHATSKIKDAGDLSAIGTLGFRGEALAAIASVSKVTLKTRQKDTEGIEVTYHGGLFVEEGSTAINIGTTIMVADLFYNTPARFKYIKSELSEKNAISDIFDRLALANPKVRMKLFMDGKLVRETFGTGDYHSLIDQIYGKAMTHGMIEFSHVFQKVRISGHLVSPSISRTRKKDISVIVNGRYIRNYALVQAVVDGYHSFMMVDKYPIAVIEIEMDPSLLDVNVHPQKYEIKFANESMMSYQIELFVKDALLKHKHPVQDNVKQIIEKPTETYTPLSFELHEQIIEEPKEIQTTQAKFPPLDYVGVFGGTYILFQNREGLFLMDQHAAQERIRYEYYFEALKHPKSIQKGLLFPRPLHLTQEDLSVIEAYQHIFRSFGFEFNQKVDLISLPIWLLDGEIDLAIEGMVSMLQTKGEIDLGILRDRLAKDISCKGAIKANQHISKAEIDHLLKDLEACDNPYTCPHGRPTFIKITHHDVEKMFKRVV